MGRSLIVVSVVGEVEALGEDFEPTSEAELLEIEDSDIERERMKRRSKEKEKNVLKGVLGFGLTTDERWRDSLWFNCGKRISRMCATRASRGFPGSTK